MMYYNDIYIRHFSHSSLSKKVFDVGASPADDLRESHRLQVADGPVHHLRVRGVRLTSVIQMRASDAPMSSACLGALGL